METAAMVSDQEGSINSDPARVPDGFTDLPEDEDDVLPFS